MMSISTHERGARRRSRVMGVALWAAIFVISFLLYAATVQRQFIGSLLKANAGLVAAQDRPVFALGLGMCNDVVSVLVVDGHGEKHIIDHPSREQLKAIQDAVGAQHTVGLVMPCPAEGSGT